MAVSVQVIGANGFVGRHVVRYLNANGYVVHAVTREPVPQGLREKGVKYRLLKMRHDARLIFDDIDTLIFAAGRAHIRGENSSASLDRFVKVNVELAMRFAEAARAAGVRRFIYLSSIGVNGEETPPSKAFCESDTPSPLQPYAVSKLKAEQVLVQCFAGSVTELVIIRPPLIYGIDAPGNFSLLLRLLRSPWPLPLSGVDNRRSLIYIGNLVDFIRACIEHPNAANEVFLISDGDDISTSQLLRLIRKIINKPTRLFYAPKWLVWALACSVGRPAALKKLYGSLVVDASKARIVLGWRPPYSLRRGLSEMFD